VILAVLQLLSILDPKELLKGGGYVLLFFIVFAESGLLVGFFLPGDSLLFTAGVLATGGALSQKLGVDFNIFVVMLGCFAMAVVGDQVGYLIGSKAGPRLFNRPDSRLFKQEHVDKAEEFFERYGSKAIILARFVPVIRTFVPTVAGVSRMDYGRFLRFNLIGGAIWGAGIPALGYFFGQIDFVEKNLELTLIAVVGISVLPIAFEIWKARKERRAAA
jgi:membrane-associated protein